MVHFDYLQHVFDVFKSAGHVNMTAPSHGTSTINGVVHKWGQFSTVSLSSWNELQAQWYVNGVKVIPSNIQEVLTPIGLAYWFMDDGGWTNTGIHLATNNFTKQDTLRLISVLENKFGLKCSLHSRNRIYIWVGSCSEFIEIVRPYIHTGMSYKLSPKT
jgi:hypothetical protein